MKKNEIWEKRNSKKNHIRQSIWQKMQDKNLTKSSPWQSIPNFIESDIAAEKLFTLDKWKKAKVVKCNPDKAQASIRLAALNQGKYLYVPVPELIDSCPFLLLDPCSLKKRKISFDEVVYPSGFLKYGKKIRFQEMKKLDFIVVGSVAVSKDGGRIGKGAGFADIEMGLFCQFGLMSSETPIVSTVHSEQIVDDGQLFMADHDFPLDYIASPLGLIKTNTSYVRPSALVWESIQPDQYRSIPFLEELSKINNFK